MSIEGRNRIREQIEAIEVPDGHMMLVSITDLEGDIDTCCASGEDIKSKGVNNLRDMCFNMLLSIGGHFHSAFMVGKETS